MYRLTRTSKTLYKKLWQDYKFSRTAIESFDSFYTQQFVKAYEYNPQDKTEADDDIYYDLKQF
jgi:hypothetical protein